MDYKSKRWKTLRVGILRRDGYQCRECRRYGKTVQADTVHHVYPVELYPQLAWERWNLVSLCTACHNAMHARSGDNLTETGLAWCRRVSPPPSAHVKVPTETGEWPSFRRKEKRGGGVNPPARSNTRTGHGRDHTRRRWRRDDGP